MPSPLIDPNEFPELKAFSAPKARILEAALELFVSHGIAGTSLQMIANHIGVTKAAVYHQFNTKESIILTAVELIFKKLRQIISLAEAEETPALARKVLTDGIIDVAVAGRRIAGFLHQDPVMIQYYQHHEPFRSVMLRLDSILSSDCKTPQARITAAVLITAIGGAVMHPMVDGVDDKILKEQLRLLTGILLERLDQI